VPPEPDDIRRFDVGDGIYVRVPALTAAVPGGTLPTPQDDAAHRRVPPAALAAGAALAVIAVVRLGATPAGLLAAGLLAVLTALAAVDLRARVLPNRIVGPAIAVTLCWQLAFFPGRWQEWLVAGLGAGAFFLLPALLSRGAVGMGDVKLAVLLGLALGTDVTAALLVTVLAAVPAALIVLARGGRRSTMPYGPFLALGAAVVLLA
jgi:prepilin signal peptidase PulO-like enzyme (type II secretory pathway)